MSSFLFPQFNPVEPLQTGHTDLIIDFSIETLSAIRYIAPQR